LAQEIDRAVRALIGRFVRIPQKATCCLMLLEQFNEICKSVRNPTAQASARTAALSRNPVGAGSSFCRFATSESDPEQGKRRRWRLHHASGRNP